MFEKCRREKAEETREGQEKEDTMETVMKYGKGEKDKEPVVKVRKEEKKKAAKKRRIQTHRGMTVNEGQGRKGKDMAGAGMA